MLFQLVLELKRPGSIILAVSNQSCIFLQAEKCLPKKRFKDRDTRQNILSSIFLFKCDCGLCQEEAKISNDDESYEKFENLHEKVKKFEEKKKQLLAYDAPTYLTNLTTYLSNVLDVGLYKDIKHYQIYKQFIELHKSEISCYKEMYELAQISKEPSSLCLITTQLSSKS